jgi:hypothetical protein
MSEVLGKIKVLGNTIQVSEKFSKRELVVTTNEQYPQHILIEFAQDKVSLLDNYKINDEVKVSINLRGREWVNKEGESKWFNSIQGWKIEKAEAGAEAPKDEKYKGKKEYTKPLAQEFEEDDLPF